MAAHDSGSTERASHGERVMRRGGLSQSIACATLFALLCGLALTLLDVETHAQSGRNKPKQPANTAPGQTRPKRVRPAPQSAPTTSSKPDAHVPGSSTDEPPPMSSSQKSAAPGSQTNSNVEEVDSEDVVRVRTNLVVMPASVVDDRGKAVTDLKLEDFELRVDGQARPLSDVSRSETPVRMVMLFDNSDSLTTAREFEKLAAIRFFRRVMRPVDQAAIFSISTEDTLEQPFTNDVKKLVQTIERFGKPDGATSLFDGVVMAADYLREQKGRKVIVIVSDGADTTSRITDLEVVLQRAQFADCQIYAVQTGWVENANLRDLIAERRLQEMTGQTGGAMYIPKTTNDLDNAFEQISADLAQQYVLSYYPSDDQRDGRFRAITLSVPKHPNTRVRTRKGYYTPKG